MPFYEYQCKSCGHALEAMQKVNDAPLRKCPECGKAQLTRLMSAPVFRLKGGGWYETDFKGDQDHKKNLADRPDKDAAKDDAKPAGDSGATDTASKDAVKPVEKTADKPGDKAAPAAAGLSTRGKSVAPVKSTASGKSAKRGAKKTVKQTVKRRAASAAKRR